MPTERYEARPSGSDATGGAIKAFVAMRLLKWVRRWIVLLPIAFLISLLDPVMSPLKWWALGFAGFGLLLILVSTILMKRVAAATILHIHDPDGLFHDREKYPEGVTIDLTAKDAE